MKNYLNLILVCLLFLFVSCSCVQKSQIRNEKRIVEVKWMYFESNFYNNKIGCVHCNCMVDTNICFIDELKIESRLIGDTVEYIVHSIYKNDSLCSPCCESGFVDVFGILPNVDTVAYRSNLNYIIKKRVIEVDSIAKKWEWLGFHPRAKQKKEFKEFIIKNKSKLNKWLKEEAIRRGYITKD